MATVARDVVFETTTQEEIRTELDQLGHEMLGISGEEFLKQWANGGLDPYDPTVARLAVFARLLSV